MSKILIIYNFERLGVQIAFDIMSIAKLVYNFEDEADDKILKILLKNRVILKYGDEETTFKDLLTKHYNSFSFESSKDFPEINENEVSFSDTEDSKQLKEKNLPEINDQTTLVNKTQDYIKDEEEEKL